jgi:hypothetical protein
LMMAPRQQGCATVSTVCPWCSNLPKARCTMSCMSPVFQTWAI